jgi:hypothetical protein
MLCFGFKCEQWYITTALGSIYRPLTAKNLHNDHIQVYITHVNYSPITTDTEQIKQFPCKPTVCDALQFIIFLRVHVG